MTVTIKDVALAAGVSQATVSRVMNGRESVDPGLAEKVRAVAAALDYRPSSLARNLRLKQTAIWLLMISDIENPFFTTIARAVEDVAQQEGYSVILCNTDENQAKEEQYIGVALQEQASGVILSPVAPDADVSRLIERNIPVVALDRPLPAQQVDAVLIDSLQGAILATLHLIHQGWQRVVCITGHRETDTARQRAEGYRRAMSAAAAPSVVEHADFRASGGRAAAARLLDASEPPDAIFVANNLMTIGVLEELAARGLRPGRDLGIASFDDPPWARLLDPPLTCVAQPSYEMGARAARLLAERLTGSRTGQGVREVLQPALVERLSSQRSPRSS